MLRRSENGQGDEKPFQRLIFNTIAQIQNDNTLLPLLTLPDCLVLEAYGHMTCPSGYPFSAG